MRVVAIVAACLLCSASEAHAFRILFYDVRPAEKLMDLPSLDGSRTVSPKQFDKLTLLDLLDYDLIYVDITATDLHHLSAHAAILNEAVSAGVGLYLQGDIAAYAASPIDAPATKAIQVRGYDLPNEAYNHPLAADAELMPEDFGDAHSAKARGFIAVSDAFTVIAEAETRTGQRYPVLLAGVYGKGRVVLRTHEMTDPDAYGVEKIDAAIIAWITSHETEPRLEPLAWIVDNHPRKTVSVTEIQAEQYVRIDVRPRKPLVLAAPPATRLHLSH